MIDLNIEVRELKKDLYDREIKRLINKLLKTKHKAGVITKREWKNGNKKVKEILKCLNLKSYTST